MKLLIKKGFKKDNIISYGNMFLIGNGHIGYRGTLEEFSKNELVGLNIVGEYDKYQDLWRESINMPNPFYFSLEGYNVLTNPNVEHKQILDIKKALFKRISNFDKVIIKSERFIIDNDDILFTKYEIIAKNDVNINLSFGMDLNIYEINGPHFLEKELTINKNIISFIGKTNEEKKYYEKASYYVKNANLEIKDNYFKIKKVLKRKESISIYVIAKVSTNQINDLKINKTIYQKYKKEHILDYQRKWEIANIDILGNDKADFAIKYSIYQLLILGNSKYETSIPARGVSAQTYKGAIFWDSEIFMLPFFTLTFPSIAKSLLKYRINTLNGAKKKAKEYGYEGAFYAWESQDEGKEACSKYNVTDWKTNKPIRTYFDEKQIHISFDIVYALLMYSKIIGNDDIFKDGGIDVLVEVIKFTMSRASLINNKYHLLDVMGPDEYHERVDDNAFSSYLAFYTGTNSLKVLKRLGYDEKFINAATLFYQNFYLPKENSKHLIEQFEGYFNLEDCSVNDIKNRLENEKEYWGNKAKSTRVIKQADVIALLVLENEHFNFEIMKSNFDFYYPYTEHGSSLSSSMYSILAFNIGYLDIGYEMFMKSACIDLGSNQKMFAGGIYIGGTHPASNAGAYLSILYGMCHLRFNQNSFTLNPNLPKKIKGLRFKLNYQGNLYQVIVNKDNSYETWRIKND